MEPNEFPQTVILLYAQAGTTNAVLSSAALDTIGYEHLFVTVLAGTAAVSNVMQVCSLTESETSTAVSNATAVATMTGQTTVTTGFTMPVGYTTATSTLRKPIANLSLDLRGRARYIFLNVEPLTVTNSYTAVALLSKAKELPTVASVSETTSTSVNGVNSQVIAAGN